MCFLCLSLVTVRGRMLLLLIIAHCLNTVSGHGRLRKPPSRSTMWRHGFDTPRDYNDHETFCGGFGRQWRQNRGLCGVCGDPYDAPQPRRLELGGKYGLGVLAANLTQGQILDVEVELTAYHKGYFEFRLCPHNTKTRPVAQTCLDRNLLVLSQLRNLAPPYICDTCTTENWRTTTTKRTTTSSTGRTNTKFYPPPPSATRGLYKLTYQLPPHLTCSLCVLQWRYVAGNSWGKCSNGTQGMGCGPQVGQLSLLCSHWSRSLKTVLLLVEIKGRLRSNILIQPIRAQSQWISTNERKAWIFLHC